MIKRTKKIIAREWLYLFFSFAFAIATIPFIVQWIIPDAESPGGIYHAMLNDPFNKDLFVFLIPYLLLQLIRATVWAVKALNKESI